MVAHVDGKITIKTVAVTTEIPTFESHGGPQRQSARQSSNHGGNIAQVAESVKAEMLAVGVALRWDLADSVDSVLSQC